MANLLYVLRDVKNNIFAKSANWLVVWQTSWLIGFKEAQYN